MKINLRIFLAIFLLFNYCYLTSQNNQNSLLFEITGNGLKKPSYLYGTMHVSKKVAFRLSEQFFNNLKKCDLVALESNPEKWLTEMKNYGLFDNYDYKTAGLQLENNDFYNEAFKIYTPDNQTIAGLLSYDPDIINNLLFRNNNNSQNFEENTYIDLFIYQAANKWNKEVVSLENIKTSLLQGELFTLLDRESDNNDMVTNNNQYDSYSKLEAAYREGNVEEINKISRENGVSKNFEKYILDDRSMTFANSIDSIIKLNKSLFSGVGAAHLAGEKGVIELLRKKGYTVTPIKPNITPNSTKIKGDIDALVKVIPLKKFYSSDSLFSYLAPEKLTTIMNINSLEVSVYPEMVNGIYYNIFRFKTFANFNNYTAEKFNQKIDSLLYENIPGKILKKTLVTNSLGNKGFAIHTSTKNGDIISYLIYVTNTEIIIFKIGASEILSKTTFYNDFLKSVQFYQNPKTNKVFTPKTEGFNINAYTDFFYEKYNPSNTFGIGERFFTYKEDNHSFNGLVHAYYYDFEKLEADTSELNLICTKFVHNFNNIIDLKMDFIQKSKFPQLNFSFKSDNSFVTGEVLIVGCNYYLLFTVNHGDYYKDFINSFKLTIPKYVNPIREIKDNDMYFSVKDELTNDSASLERDVYKMYKKIKTKETPDSTSYLSSYLSKAYFSPSTGERVNIELWKYNDYNYINESDFFNNIKKMYKERSLDVASFNKSKINDHYKVEFYLSNQESNKKIKSVVYIKNGLCYLLTVPYDSIIGISDWSNNFINSFVPNDTVIGKNIFEKKYDELFRNLSSSDEMKIKELSNILNELEFNDTIAESYIRFLNSDDFHKTNPQCKSLLLYNCRFIKNPSILTAISKLYNYYSDSSLYQANMLEGLVKSKRQNATDLFLNLVTKNPPLLKDQNLVNYIFNALYDSLELCKNFAPKIFSLTRYDEYKRPVYQLMSELVSKKIIKPSSYSSLKEDIYQEALYEYKRLNSNSSLNLNDPKNEELNLNLVAYIYYSMAIPKYNVAKANFISDHIPFVNLVQILMPFYSKDVEVKNFINKLLVNKKQLHVFPIYCSALLNNAFNDKDLNEYYMINATYRIAFYTFLIKNKIEPISFFQNNSISQLIESNLTINNFNLYEGVYSKLNDSYIFIDSLNVHNKKEKGKIYIYRNFVLGDFKETWTVLFVNEQLKNGLNEIEILSSNYEKNPEKEKSEVVDDIGQDFYYRYNSRYYSKLFVN